MKTNRDYVSSVKNMKKQDEKIILMYRLHQQKMVKKVKKEE